MRIGVFDSGIGGKAVALQLQRLLPEADILLVNDHANVPYGDKSTTEITRLTDLAIQPLLVARCDVIVIACNTATTVALPQLRKTYPDTHFVGIEPMVKSAAKITQSKIIAVCATPRTLESKRYNDLKQTWAKNITIIEPNCQDWAQLIEYGNSKMIDVEAMVESLVRKKVDVIVLGCTHYHWIKKRFIDAAGPNITILEPTDVIAERITFLFNQSESTAAAN